MVWRWMSLLLGDIKHHLKFGIHMFLVIKKGGHSSQTRYKVPSCQQVSILFRNLSKIHIYIASPKTGPHIPEIWALPIFEGGHGMVKNINRQKILPMTCWRQRLVERSFQHWSIVSHKSRCHDILAGGFNPFLKNVSISQDKGEHTKYLKPPPSIGGFVAYRLLIDRGLLWLRGFMAKGYGSLLYQLMSYPDLAAILHVSGSMLLVVQPCISCM